MDALREIGYEGFASVKVYRHLNFEEAAETSLAYLLALPGAENGNSGRSRGNAARAGVLQL
jgi:hypothetical protein